MRSARLFLLTLCLGMMDASSSETPIRQKRAWIVDTFSIEEEYPGPFPYELGVINLERNYLVNFLLRGQGVDKEPKDVLSIDSDGMIYVHRKVDYEQHKSLNLTFEARNSKNTVDTRLGVDIRILDINDHPPKFLKSMYEISVEESLLQGSNVLTVVASDDDKPQTPNSTFEYRISSVTPQTPNAEFFIEQNGRISFKGCLNYDIANKYIILVEAKDKGEVVRLSSTCTIVVNLLDKNNHMPVFSGRTGPSSVKERESGTSILKLHVADKDKKSTPAWEVVYTLYGDTDNHFAIQTDPQTNDGILTVVKPLDFEIDAKRNLSVSVKNKEPFFSCEVRRRTSYGLWDVEVTGGTDNKGTVPAPFTEQITVLVEDINDPPVFNPPDIMISLEENAPVAQLIHTFTAIDLDGSHSNEFLYLKGEDPGNWVTIDSKTGQVITSKTMDRESSFVVNNTYTVIVYAVDKGTPPMTGTGTLFIFLRDQNDNVPLLLDHTLTMCLSNGPYKTNITAHDADLYPFASPFSFEVLGDVKEKWHFDSSNGATATLVMEPKVYSGTHELQLKISDAQGHFSYQNLSVTVCNCSITPHCGLSRSTGYEVHISAIGVIFATLAILLGVLLLAFFVSCRNKKSFIQITGEECLLKYNSEMPGSDCQVPLDYQEQVDKRLITNNDALKERRTGQRPNQNIYEMQPSCQQAGGRDQYSVSNYQIINNRYHYRGGFFRRTVQRSSSCSTTREGHVSRIYELLRIVITQKVQSITAEEVLANDKPRVYAYEGDAEIDYQLDSISINEVEFTPDKLLDLGPRFATLAAITRPVQE